jgi:histidine triad (HIT) family protein
MFNHAPDKYHCPFCRLVAGEATSVSDQDDVIYRDSAVTAFMASGWWPNNKGHVLIVPNEHYENIYDLPSRYGEPIQRVSRRIAVAFKQLYDCDGVSTRQHNEPHGGQDVWHYHVHIYPRYEGDNLCLTRRQASTPEERAPFAARLRDHLLRSPEECVK